MLTKEQFEEMLNVTTPLVTVFGINFEAGTLLRKMDPIAFNDLYTSSQESDVDK